MIEIKNVCKTYTTKTATTHALNNVSLTINDGEIFGIIGYSGAGKSTLIRMLNCLETCDSGSVLIDGTDIQKLNKKELMNARRDIGMIFQHFNLLWSSTVVENIELPLMFAGVDKNTRREKAMQLCHMVGLDGKEFVYPSTLSGGQKQRVGIARALANDPHILLCDEATSALDPETTESILNLLKTINNDLGITIVMITHQMEVVQSICEKMAVMSDGEIVEVGDVKQLFAHPQHEVTRKFVHNIEGSEDIEDLNRRLKFKYPDGMLVRISFTGNNVDEAIISSAIRKVDFDVSIVESNISIAKDGMFGVTYLSLLDGSKEEYTTFIQLLKGNDIEVEVIA